MDTTNAGAMLLKEPEEIQIPTSLKFMLNALKILSQTPLTTENYLAWSSQIQTIFQANGYLKYLDLQAKPPSSTITDSHNNNLPNPNYKKWILINHNLIAAVIATISPSIQNFVLRKGTIAEVWEALKFRLQSTTNSRIIQLKEILHSLNMQGDSMTQYLTNVKKVLDQLEAADEHVKDDDVMIYIMNGLPSTYNGFKTAFRISKERRDLNEFYSLLLTEEMNINRQSKMEMAAQTMALNTYKNRFTSNPRNSKKQQQSKPQTAGNPSKQQQNFSNPGQIQQNRGDQKLVQCQICAKPGHSAKNC